MHQLQRESQTPNPNTYDSHTEREEEQTSTWNVKHEDGSRMEARAEILTATKREIKSVSPRAKSFRFYFSKRRITSVDSICNQNSQIDKANRAKSQKRVIKADFDIVTFRSFASIARKRNASLGCDSAPVAVLDALSNDTNRAQNGPLGAEI